MLRRFSSAAKQLKNSALGATQNTIGDLKPLDLKVGSPIAGFNIFVNGKDPVIQEDSAYPPWIYDALIETPKKFHFDDKEITTRQELKRSNILKMRANNLARAKRK